MDPTTSNDVGLPVQISAGSASAHLQRLDIELKEKEIKLKEEEIRRVQTERKHKSREVFVPVLTAFIIGIATAGGPLMWKGNDAAEKIALATHAADERIAEAKQIEMDLRLRCELEAENRKRAELSESGFKAQLIEAEKSLALKKAELQEVKALQEKFTLRERVLTAHLEAQKENHNELIKTLLRVNLELNGPDQKLSEAKRESEERQEAAERILDTTSQVASQDGMLGMLLMGALTAPIADQGRQAADKVSVLTTRLYEERIGKANVLIKDAIAKFSKTLDFSTLDEGRTHGAAYKERVLKALPVSGR